jgi:hypothetical protein
MAQQMPMINVGGSNLPPEIMQQQQALNRQQQMAQLLMQQGQSMPSGQMVSGRYVAPSFFQYAAPLFQTYAGTKLAEKGDKAMADLLRNVQTGKTQAEESIIKALTPQPAQINEMAGPYTGNVPMPISYQPPTEPNYAEAARLIRTNQYGAGKEFMPQIAKNLIPETPSAIKEFEYAQKNPSYTEYLMGLKKASAPSMTAITNVQAFEPFKSKAQGQMGEVLIKNFETLQNIPTAIRTLDRAAELAPQSFAGSFGEQKLELAKFFNNNLGTNINPSKVANTEELRSALFTNVMENLKKLDASPSQEQQRVLQQSMGSLATDPTALPRVINTYKQILIDKAETHNKKVSQAESGPAKMEFPFDIRIPLQNTGGMPSQSAIDAEIARRRGGR